ncbi:hypothetical protein ASD64_18310 [Mesorhizobium sp. Root157]|nr:hypothetical protein ASD64_18310 [Mesorhizobium sp. Root157]
MEVRLGAPGRGADAVSLTGYSTAPAFRVLGAAEPNAGHVVCEPEGLAMLNNFFWSFYTITVLGSVAALVVIFI